MTRTTIILILLSLGFLSACKNSVQPLHLQPSSTKQIDTTNAIKIGDHWTTPKPTFEFNSILDDSGDTLKLVTCSDFVYFPFGEIKTKFDLQTSNLKNFKILDRVETINNEESEFQILTLNSSRLILYFDNDSEASKHSYIFKGEIRDINVYLNDGIMIGMTKEDFFSTFFKDFPKELNKKYNVIIFESCVQDITHTYTFNDNKLQSITFVTENNWNVNY